jgi:hypothetical protein
MKTIRLALALALAATLLVGCGERPASPTETVAPGAGGASTPPGEGGLDLTNQLALGTLKLEETEHAVTPAQADEELPLWQIVQTGSLAGDAETNAVLKQIEGRMDEAQLAAINSMGLTFEDMREWLEAQGIEMPAAASREGGPGASQKPSEEEQVRFREEVRNMSREQRAARMAELGIQPPKGAGPGAMRGGGGGGQGSVLLDPLVALLTWRAT